MESSTLLSMPAEVRLNIYSYLFEDASIHIDSSTSSTKPGRGRPVLAPLLETCTFFRNEAGPSYFSRVRVCSDVHQGVEPTGLLNWLHKIGDLNVKLLRKFELRWNNYIDITLDLEHNAIPARNTSIQEEPAEPLLEKILDLTKNPIEPYSALTIPTPEHMAHISTHNPTASTQVSSHHTLSIKGVPRITCPELYWKLHGTKEYCAALTKQVFPRLAATLKGRPRLHLTLEEIAHFVMDLDMHAAHLRWLWYW
ncbi:unnamed protein product [Zymoseptoria tritici ST99CH_3D7]|uniref:F-box domain-containing protein n=1 Tax=Zymoseptoria tritici (strain ST99CH_3D7) TaxID=1276538 RepID=A0A1X7S0T3_ZYMT9|nr:unnamed protein product [Zymoseptoria tritici ST99CH_3D7]